MFCPQCGQALKANSRFCHACGTSLSELSPPARPGPSAAAAAPAARPADERKDDAAEQSSPAAPGESLSSIATQVLSGPAAVYSAASAVLPLWAAGALWYWVIDPYFGSDSGQRIVRSVGATIQSVAAAVDVTLDDQATIGVIGILILFLIIALANGIRKLVDEHVWSAVATRRLQQEIEQRRLAALEDGTELVKFGVLKGTAGIAKIGTIAVFFKSATAAFALSWLAHLAILMAS
jgi:hypothetical protein